MKPWRAFGEECGGDKQKWRGRKYRKQNAYNPKRNKEPAEKNEQMLFAKTS